MLNKAALVNAGSPQEVYGVWTRQDYEVHQHSDDYATLIVATRAADLHGDPVRGRKPALPPQQARFMHDGNTLNLHSLRSMPKPPYPRDLTGYGRKPPHPHWPGQARIALQFVLNYEEGAENSVLHGDPASETFLSEMIGATAYPMRHMSMESLFEYGSRAGLWRVLRLFESRRLPLTIFACAMALQRHAEATAAFVELEHEIACHGLRWINYQQVDEQTERRHMAEAVEIQRALTGSAPLGWYTGRDSPNTRKLVLEHGGFLYDADSYADDLPYWTEVQCSHGIRPQLVVPYTLDSNDMRFTAPQGFNSGSQFFDYLRDAFDVLYAEGDPRGLNAPKMLSIGLHCRIVGRPARLAALAHFLDHVGAHAHVWVCRRVDIARHWRNHHPYTATRP